MKKVRFSADRSEKTDKNCLDLFGKKWHEVPEICSLDAQISWHTCGGPLVFREAISDHPTLPKRLRRGRLTCNSDVNAALSETHSICFVPGQTVC